MKGAEFEAGYRNLEEYTGFSPRYNKKDFSALAASPTQWIAFSWSTSMPALVANFSPIAKGIQVGPKGRTNDKSGAADIELGTRVPAAAYNDANKTLYVLNYDSKIVAVDASKGLDNALLAVGKNAKAFATLTDAKLPGYATANHERIVQMAVVNGKLLVGLTNNAGLWIVDLASGTPSKKLANYTINNIGVSIDGKTAMIATTPPAAAKGAKPKSALVYFDGNDAVADISELNKEKAIAGGVEVTNPDQAPAFKNLVAVAQEKSLSWVAFEKGVGAFRIKAGEVEVDAAAPNAEAPKVEPTK